MVRAILDLGMGDALHARSFLFEYCKQKGIPHSDVIIYPGRHRSFFENDGFTLSEANPPAKGFYRYDNIGQLDIPKVYEVRANSAHTVAINAGINFDFDVQTPLNWTWESIEELELPIDFVTVNYGYDDVINPAKVCSKAWPIEYWNELVAKIGVPCVQIGAGRNCKAINGVAYNLVNKLSIKKSAAVLKKARFHIDTEGGLAILNHHIGGKSAILFGPTAIKCFGIRGNLNLWNTQCEESPCNPEYVNTVYRSVYRNKENIGCSLRCMRDLTPDYVIAQLHDNNWLPF